MALAADSKDKLLAAAARLQDLASQSLKDLLDDVRWFTTLVIASIAGLGAYRELRDEKSLSIPLAIVVLLLCVTLAVFLATVLYGNQLKRRFGEAIHSFTDQVLAIDGDADLAPSEGHRRLEARLHELRRRYSSTVDRPQTIHFYGVAAFLVAALIGIICVLFSELLLAVFGGGA